MGGQIFNFSNGSVTNLVFDCPQLTGGIGAAFLGGQNSISNLVLRMPKITSLTGAGLCYNMGAAYFLGTDVGEWNLDALTAIDNYQSEYYGFYSEKYGRRGMLFKGTMHLPSIRHIGPKAFYNTAKLDAVELGVPNFSVTNIGENAFGGSCGITRAYIGCAEGCVFKAQAFTLANGLRDILFLGAKPKVDPATGSVFGETDIAEKTVCIQLPRTSEWADVFALAEAVDDGNAFGAEYVLPPNAFFGTKYAQYLKRANLIDYGLGVKLICQYGAEYGNALTVTPQQEEYNAGDKVTLTVTCPAGEFVRWEGLPPDILSGGATERSVTFLVPDHDLDISAHIRPRWVYLPQEGVISNDVWSIVVAPKDVSRHKLKVGDGKASGAFTARGAGTLDLSGPVVELNADGTVGQSWTITEFTGSCFVPSETRGNQTLTKFIFPETVESIGGSIFSINQVAGYSALTNIALRAPDFTGIIPNYFIRSNYKVSHITFDVPRAKTIGSQAFNSSAQLDVSDWRFDSVDYVQRAAFWNQSKFSGTLHLPSVTNIDDSCVHKTAITAIHLGTGYAPRDRKILGLDYQAINTNSKLTTFVFGPYADVIYRSTDPAYEMREFHSNPALADIRFLGGPLVHTRDFLDRLLYSIPTPADGACTVVIRASNNLGWGKFADRNLTAAEETAKAALTLNRGESVMGIYVTAANERKAWLVHSPSDYDPHGTILILR